MTPVLKLVEAESVTHNGSEAGFQLPDVDQHTTIIGTNGSGKTQGAFWLLSRLPIHERPYIIFEYKPEKIVRSLARMRVFRGELHPTSRLPRQPGLYRMRLNEGEDDDAIDDFLFRVWKRGNIGCYFDEGMWLPGGPGSGVRRILSQGRSLRIPVIACLQRPVAADHFFFTEARHLWVFRLQDREDRRTVARYAPIAPDDRWPQYHSRWYDNSRDLLFDLKPVPKASSIINDLADRAPRHWLWG